jgi:hypothetical protein
MAHCSVFDKLAPGYTTHVPVPNEPLAYSEYHVASVVLFKVPDLDHGHNFSTVLNLSYLVARTL